MSSVRVRFAPSPTGPLHIGGARSALFNWLFARRYGGVFIVRIEDTDLERSSRKYEEDILASLRWLGLDWDEGVQAGGPYGPYRQTERLEIYRKYAGRLLERGHAYRCYCTEEELAAERDMLMEKGDMPRYLGRCRNLAPEDRRRMEAEGRKPVVRFRVPEDRVIHFKDLVRGDVSFECSGIGDYIIIKSDGIPTYNYAVVVDDHTMKVSHVIRAEEHLPNTPRQILIYEAMGWNVPEFAHVSLILGKDRSKMSKRHGATAVEQYRLKGYLPEALVNFMALLGWSPGGEEEIYSVEELKSQFSLERVAKSPAVFDFDKLNWLNGHYIRQARPDRLADLAVPFLDRAGYLKTLMLDDRFKWLDCTDFSFAEDGPPREEQTMSNFEAYTRPYMEGCGGISGEALVRRFEWLKKAVASVRRYLNCMEEVNDHVKIYFTDEIEIDDAEAVQVLAGGQVAAVLSCLRKKVATGGFLTDQRSKTLLKETAKETGVKAGQVFMPVRAALTGSTHGPELNEIMTVLGRDRVAGRLTKALERI
ncbi:MAG TPA: glutamate--tRNA ligase [Bacillota bacterium]|nr:glutamate--tRNA ligase [Bacillota bacterium]